MQEAVTTVHFRLTKAFAAMLFLGVFAGLAPVASAALTLLGREAFQGVGTLDSTTPGNLGTVTGSFFKRPGGPRLASDTSASSYGWSADLSTQQTVNFLPFPAGLDLSNGRPFAVDFWLYLDQPAPAGSVYVVSQILGGARRYSQIVLTGNTLAFLFGNGAGGDGGTITGPNTYTLPLRTWVQVRVAGQLTGSAADNFTAHVINLTRVAGQPWIIQGEQVNGVMYGPTVTSGSNLGCAFQGGGGGGNRARFGMYAAYRLDSWNDVTALDPQIVDPAVGPFHWYCNPATGNDGNDGTTPATAWASLAKINSESIGLGMFETDRGYPNGDTLTIDTTAANLLLGRGTFFINTRGLNVVQPGGGRTGTGELQAWEDISGSGWTLVGGCVSTYQRTLSTTDPGAVMWEDDRWLGHATGASFAGSATDAGGVTRANVASALEAVAGSFWTDGTTMYVHPFGDTNPALDGKTYTRSYARNANNAAVMLLAADLHLDGLRVRKTCIAGAADNDPGANYCFQTAQFAGGNTLMENCYGDDWSKHGVGFTDESITRHYVARNCQMEQGTPYCGYGGQSAWVDYTQSSGPGTATTLYQGCVTNENAGLIGSAAGQVDGAQPLWLTHNGEGQTFASITFDHCTLSGGNVLTYSGLGELVFEGGTLTAPFVYCSSPLTVFDGVKIVGQMPTATPGALLRLRNCLIVPPYSAPNAAAGAIDVEGCTVDVSSPYGGPLYYRADTLAFTWRNNLLLGQGWSVLAGATPAAALVFDHNAYAPGAGAIVSSYDDGTGVADRTLAWWQALGFDAGSFATAAPGIDAAYRPLAGSPLIDAGADLGPLDDYTGTVYRVRDDIGAFEYAGAPTTFAGFAHRYFDAAERADASVSGPAADPDGDGIANIMKYALGLDPTLPGTAGLPVVTTKAYQGESYLSMTFNRSPAVTDLTYAAQGSPDLIHWSDLATSTGGGAASGPGFVAETPNGNLVAVEVRDTVPIGSTATTRFLRLRVTAAGVGAK